MPIKTLRTWLWLGGKETPEHAPLRELVEALDRLDQGRAQYLARFAYLLGRVAHADRHISPEETRAMAHDKKEPKKPAGAVGARAKRPTTIDLKATEIKAKPEPAPTPVQKAEPAASAAASPPPPPRSESD